MTADQKHAAGTVVMYGGVLLGGLGAWALMGGRGVWGGVLFAVALMAVILGGVLKKRYCPRCRAGACALPTKKHGSEERGDGA